MPRLSRLSMLPAIPRQATGSSCEWQMPVGHAYRLVHGYAVGDSSVIRLQRQGGRRCFRSGRFGSSCWSAWGCWWWWWPSSPAAACTHLCLSQPGQEPELAGERVAAGRRAEQPRGRPADHAQRAARAARQPGSRRPRRADRRCGSAWSASSSAAELDEVDETLADYRKQLEQKLRADSAMADNQPERETVHKIEAALAADPRRPTATADWMLQTTSRSTGWTASWSACRPWRPSCPATCTPSCSGFAAEVRGQYRTLIVGTVGHQRHGGAGLRAVRAAVLPLDLPAAADADRRLAAGGGGRLRLPHPPATPTTRWPSWPRP